MSSKIVLLAVFLFVACSCVSSKGLGDFKFLLPRPPPPPPGCVHRGSFYEVGEVFTDKWCTEYCACKEPGVTACHALCPMEWMECAEGMQEEIEYQPVMGGMCRCPRHVCVPKA